MTFLISYINSKSTKNGNVNEILKHPIEVNNSIIDNAGAAWREWRKIEFKKGPGQRMRLKR